MAGIHPDTGSYIERAVSIVQRRADIQPAVRQAVLSEYSRTLPLMGRLDSAIALARTIVAERAAANAALQGEAGQLLGALLVMRG